MIMSNTEGASNHGFGRNAGQNITTGNHNIAIGKDSLVDTVALTTGSQNIAIGNFTRTNAADSTYATVIGYNVSGTSGYFTIGRDAQDIRAAHGVATWATVSDERYKKDITDSTAGLSFINALQPRTFKYKTLGELPETFNAYEADSTEVFKNSNTNHGFIAQEVKAAIDADDSIKDGFKLWDDREDGSQEVAEAALIPVLVKAIQELSAQNAELTTRITALEG
jgi:trimeric autotransporter adhesin